MKKTLGTIIVTLGLLTFGGSVLGAEKTYVDSNPETFYNEMFATPVAPANIAYTGISVRTETELKAALLNYKVTQIIIDGDIHMSRSITKIPRRNLEIVGRNGDIITNGHGLIGKKSLKYADRTTLSLTNLKIRESGAYTFGAKGTSFFSVHSTSGNYYGWDMAVKDVNFSGLRLATLYNGHLSFAGTNNIETKQEIAFVHTLTFEQNSSFVGTADMLDVNVRTFHKNKKDFDAFQFTGRMSDGRVHVKDNARVAIGVAAQANPDLFCISNMTGNAAFTGKITQLMIAPKAVVNINSYGEGINIAYATAKDPKIEIYGTLSLNSEGGAKKNIPAINLDDHRTQLNVYDRGNLNIKSHSSTGTIYSKRYWNQINMVNPTDLAIENTSPRAPIFNLRKSDFNLTLTQSLKRELYAWEARGGDYKFEPYFESLETGAGRFYYDHKGCSKFVSGSYKLRSLDLNNTGKLTNSIK